MKKGKSPEKVNTDFEDISNIINQNLIKHVEEQKQEHKDLKDKDVNNSLKEILPLKNISDNIRVKTKENFVFYNVMEEIVKNKALDFIRDLSVCGCDKCYYDIIAMTLNKLPPRYVVTPKGRLFAKISATETQVNSDMASILTNACLYIDKNPRHTK